MTEERDETKKRYAAEALELYKNKQKNPVNKDRAVKTPNLKQPREHEAPIPCPNCHKTHVRGRCGLPR